MRAAGFPGEWRKLHIGFAYLVVANVVGVCLAWCVNGALAATQQCPNTAFRVGPSAGLPDCRAYELVTPEHLGRTQDMTFFAFDRAIPSPEGEHLFLTSFAPLEPDPSAYGTQAVFSRTATGWVMKSDVTPATADQKYEIHLTSPDLSHMVLESRTGLDNEEKASAPSMFEIGPVGGPYAILVEVRYEGEVTVEGANGGTAGVPALSHVLFSSTDHELLPPGLERTLAEETMDGKPDLYEWENGVLKLVNIEGGGENLRLISRCGAQVGDGIDAASYGPDVVGAVSADGKKVFFTTTGSGGNCQGPGSLYMRRDGGETVEIAAPQGVALAPSDRVEARFNEATPDGSEVLFNTATPLLPGETGDENKLFLYDTVTGRLTLVVSSAGLAPVQGTEGNQILLSEDGSTVYYMLGASIYRYEVGGMTNFVATAPSEKTAGEPSYTTPNGEFLTFVSAEAVEFIGPHGREIESRGVHGNQLYRYDASNGSVICVSCGVGVAPAEGEMIEPRSLASTRAESPPFVQMSDDGQRVFFQTTAQLVTQDANSQETNVFRVGGTPGMDVYEWESEGAEEAPGVFCRAAVGCTHLISAGEDVGGEFFLGASKDGRDVFFSSAAQLVSQATPEFSNIYDARVDGGFQAPLGSPECLSCQGVGSPPVAFAGAASESFAGGGNPAKPKPKPKPGCKRGYRRAKHGRCLRARSRKAAGRR